MIKIIVAGQKTMFSLRNKRRPMKKSVILNKYGPFFIIFPLPVMLKFTVHITAVHLFTCVAKAVTSQRSRELPGNEKYLVKAYIQNFERKKSFLYEQFLPSAESFKKGCCQLQAKVCARSTG